MRVTSKKEIGKKPSIVDSLEKECGRLRDINVQLSTLLNSLEVNYLTFDKEASCGDVVSPAALDILGYDPRGKKLWDILGIDESHRHSFQDWYSFLVDEKINFEDLAALAPTRLPIEGREVRVVYQPIKDSTGQLLGVATQFDDMTSRLEAEEKIQRQQEYSQMVVTYIRDKKSFIYILTQVRELAESLMAWSDRNGDDIFAVMRKLHTIKGATGNLSMIQFSEFVNSLESDATKYIYGTQSEQEIQQGIHQIGQRLMDELQRALQSELDFITDRDFGFSKKKEVSVDALFSMIGYLVESKIPSHIVDKFVAELVCEPFEDLLLSIEAAAYSRALMLQKDVEVEITCNPKFMVIGEAYQNFFDELRHLINNCLDHGVEVPSERLKVGKPASGKIQIVIKEHKDLGRVELTVRDDGKGIDPGAIRRKLDHRRVEHDQLTDEQVLQFIFDDGLSTRDVADQFAGRGVGLSAFFQAVRAMSGTVKVSSNLGHSTQFDIDLPIIDKSLANTNRLFKAS